jgi:hypothetical protein
MGSLTPLWKAVDNFATYPQLRASYPQNYPQAHCCPGGNEWQFSTVSTGPTIEKGLRKTLLDSQVNFFRKFFKNLESSLKSPSLKSPFWA